MMRNIFVAAFLLASIVCFFCNFTSDGDNKPHPYDFGYPEAFGKPYLSDKNPLTVEGVWLGRLLFYDSLLSTNGKVSCGSCHRQELSFTDGKVLAVGLNGDTLARNTMSLVNLAWGRSFFWDGRAVTLEDVVRQPIANPKEMGAMTEAALTRYLETHQYYPGLFKKAFPGEPISIVTVSKAIAQFMYTIVSSPHKSMVVDSSKDLSKIDQVKDSALLKENSVLGALARISLMQCKSCHPTEGFHGQIVTVDENDSLFKAPTFMNIGFTGPYFHDGRFKTLREVFQFYNDNMETLQIKNPDLMVHQKTRVKFTEYDLEHAEKLFAIFNDTSIITNPAFSNPFNQNGFNWPGLKDDFER
jgi:cytochrome c peroxidase